MEIDSVNREMHEPRRVLHVIGAMDRGGAETLVMNIYRNINRSSVQFDFLVHEKRECDFDSEIRALGGSIYNIERFNGLNLIPYKRQCRDFFSQHHNYCAVHVHIGSSAALVIREAKKYNLPCIAHSHNTNPNLSIMELGFRFFSFPTRFIADYYLACSREAGVDRFGKRVVSGNRFAVLNNGIDIGRYVFSEEARSNVRERLGVQGTETAICHIGRFSDEKNHRFLLEVFIALLEHNPEAHLFLVGRGPLESEIKQLAVDLGIRDKVHFLGVRDDVNRILMAMDIFVFPSKWEGLGIAAIEAQATGLPCILSPALPDIAVCCPYAHKASDLSSAVSWAREIDGLGLRSNADRHDGVEYVRAAGFDIANSVVFLDDLYLNKLQEGA